MNNVILTICGSSTAWMIKKIIQNKKGLYGRLSDQICLQPFKLDEVELYLQSRYIYLDSKQLSELYMIVGGVAKYLSFVKPGMSAAQTINHLCFTSQGPLYSEFDELYSSLFGKADLHVKVVEVLSKKRNGVTREELMKLLKRQSGGQLSAVLEELEKSGIITLVRKFNAKIKESLIRLVDEYSYFYLNWINPVKREILQGSDSYYWQKIHADSVWKSWSGFAFETICLKHIDKIKSSLGLASVRTLHSQWSYTSKNQDDDSVQIDLIIDRADNCINLCEIKFCNEEYIVTKECAKKLAKKKTVFQSKTKTSKTVFTKMITPYEVEKNQHYIGLVDSQLV